MLLETDFFELIFVEIAIKKTSRIVTQLALYRKKQACDNSEGAESEWKK